MVVFAWMVVVAVFYIPLGVIYHLLSSYCNFRKGCRRRRRKMAY